MCPEVAGEARFLEPGEVVFAEGAGLLKTLLGSCVAITFWHPRLRVGAMCHFLVPEREGGRELPWDGRFGREAIGRIAQTFQARGLKAEAFEVKLFGGGNMFPGLGSDSEPPIGTRNVEAGRRLLREAGFRIASEDLGGDLQRMVVFDLSSGDVWVRQGAAGPATDAAPTKQRGRTR